MNINELVNSGSHISVNIELDDLRTWHQEVIEDTRLKFEKQIIEDKAESYPSPQQVSGILGVDLVTLWRWKKRGYLVPIEIGGKRRYLMSEVKALMKGERAK